MARRTSRRRVNGESGGTIYGSGANKVFKRALARSSYPKAKPRSGSVRSSSANIRLGGGTNGAI